MIFSTPISELFHSRSEGEKIARLSHSLESRPDRSIDFVTQHSVTHAHISDPALDINLAWSNRQQRMLSDYLSKQMPSTAISFHLARDYPAVAMDDSGRYLPVGKSKTEQQMLENAVANCEWVRAQFGCRVLIENNNYYDSGAYEIVGRADFITKVIDETGAGFLFDYAHAWVSAVNLGQSIDEYCSGLRMSRVEQLHVSMPKIFGKSAVDSHGLPSAEMVRDVVFFVSQHTQFLFPVTVEYYQSSGPLIKLLQQLGDGRVG